MGSLLRVQRLASAPAQSDETLALSNSLRVGLVYSWGEEWSERVGFEVREKPVNESSRAIVTGASANHYKSLMQMLRSLGQVAGYRGYVRCWDLGLKDWQRSEGRGQLFLPHLVDISTSPPRTLLQFSS